MTYSNRKSFLILVSLLFIFSGCISYSFTGTSIPADVRTIYIPFFPDRSQSGLGDLSNQINEVLINRFVNQSRLSINNDRDEADAYLEGAIQGYVNRPFSIGGNEQANLNEIQITVRALFQYAADDEPLWDKNFTGSATYDVVENPVEGELQAARQALEQIANNMFNDAVSSW